MKPPIEGMKTQPAFTDNNMLMSGAFLDCVSWAGTEPEFLKQFKKDTGFDLNNVLKASGLNKMIDEASGHDKAVITAFADWVAENIWGVDDKSL